MGGGGRSTWGEGHTHGGGRELRKSQPPPSAHSLPSSPIAQTGAESQPNPCAERKRPLRHPPMQDGSPDHEQDIHGGREEKQLARSRCPQFGERTRLRQERAGGCGLDPEAGGAARSPQSAAAAPAAQGLPPPRALPPSPDRLSRFSPSQLTRMMASM